MALVLTVVGSALWIAESGRPPVPPLDRATRHYATAPNVLLLTLDGLGAEVVERDDIALLMPVFARLMSEGTRFTRARAPSSSPALAYAQLMTGSDGPFPERWVPWPEERLLTSPEPWPAGAPSSLDSLLVGSGYLTAGFSSSGIHYDQPRWTHGFLSYEACFGPLRGLDRTFLLRPLSWLTGSSRRDEELVRRVADFRDLAGGQRWYVWAQLALPDQEPGRLALPDQRLGELLDALDARDGLDRTLLVLSSTRGSAPERDGDRANLRDVRLRVPLLFRHPGLVQAGRALDCEVALGDVAPSLSELIGSWSDGFIDGWSLAAALGGEPCRSHPVRIGTRSHGAEGSLEDQGLIDQGRKLILRANGSVELYDLREDPLERVNISGREPQVLGRMQGRLKELSEGGSGSRAARRNATMPYATLLPRERPEGGAELPLPHPSAPDKAP